MNSAALYYPDEDHAQLRYKNRDYWKTNGLEIRSEHFQRIFQQELKDPVLNPRKYVRKTIVPWLKEHGYRSATGSVLLISSNGLVSQWLLDEKQNTIAISGFLRFPSDQLQPDTKGYRVKGKKGTWFVSDTIILDGTCCYILESEVGTEEYLVLDGQGNVLVETEQLDTKDMVSKIRKKRDALDKRADRIGYAAGNLSSEEKSEHVRKYPEIPRGKLAGRDVSGQRVSVRKRLQEKQSILQKYTMGKKK